MLKLSAAPSILPDGVKQADTYLGRVVAWCNPSWPQLSGEGAARAGASGPAGTARPFLKETCLVPHVFFLWTPKTRLVGSFNQLSRVLPLHSFPPESLT